MRVISFSGRIVIQTLAGRRMDLNVTDRDTVQSVVWKIEEQWGISPNRQRLVFESFQLQDGRSLGDYGIEDGSILQLVIRRQTSNDGQQHGTTGHINHDNQRLLAEIEKLKSKLKSSEYAQQVQSQQILGLKQGLDEAQIMIQELRKEISEKDTLIETYKQNSTPLNHGICV